MAAVGAWERFIADLVGAVTLVRLHPGKRGITADATKCWEPGTFDGDSSHHPECVGGRLKNLGYLDSADLVARWVADVSTSWAGVKPTRWQRRLGPGTEEELGVDAFLSSAILVRNAGAHRSAQALARKARAKNLPFPESDAESTTIQHGYARGVAALVIQVLDSTIAAICEDRSWCSDHRLPQAWFLGAPQPKGRHEGINFWQHTLPRAAG